MKKIGEHMTQAGAEKLAGKIRGYWAKRGHTVNVTLERIEVPTERGPQMFAIRSDMIGGLPSERVAVRLAA